MTAAPGVLSRLDPAAIPFGFALICLAAMNGWAARLLAPNAPAVSLFAVLTLSVALSRATPAPAGLNVARGGVMAAAIALILAPIGAAAWIALALLAVVGVGPGASRWLLLGLSAAELFSAVGLNQTKALLLPLEARAAGWMLGAAGQPAEVAGNAIALGDRLTIVAAGCSGAPGALFAALGAVALLIWRTPHADRAAGALAAVIAAGVAAAANLLRLSVMAVDETLYAAAHGQAGALATDLVASLGVAGAVLLAERRAR